MKKLYQLGMCIFCQIIFVGLLYSPQAFSRLSPDDPFFESPDFVSPNEDQNVHVVFFTREGRFLIPECRISVDKYPQILFDQLQSLLRDPHIKRELKENPTFNNDPLYGQHNIMAFHLLEECDPGFSLKLVGFAEHFEFYPQVAFGPILAGAPAAAPIVSKAAVATASFAAAASCALGGVLGFGGTYILESENQRAERALAVKNTSYEWFNYVPTQGEALAITGVVGGGALGAAQTNAYVPIVQKTIEKIALRAMTAISGVFGSLCGLGGGAVGIHLWTIRSVKLI